MLECNVYIFLIHLLKAFELFILKTSMELVVLLEYYLVLFALCVNDPQIKIQVTTSNKFTRAMIITYVVNKL